MSEDRPKYSIVDNDTGEVLDNYRPFPEPFNSEGYRFPSHKAGARLFDDVQFPPSMSPAEIGRMTILSKLMIAKTNMLGYRKGRDIIPYTADELGGFALLKGTRGRAFILKMCRLRVMQKINTNSGAQYYINPAYFMASGQRLTLDLFLLFRDELTPIVPGWVMRGFLSQVKDKAFLPYSAVSEAAEIARKKKAELINE